MESSIVERDFNFGSASPRSVCRLEEGGILKTAHGLGLIMSLCQRGERKKIPTRSSSFARIRHLKSDLHKFWKSWSLRVHYFRLIDLPPKVSPFFELVLCSPMSKSSGKPGVSGSMVSGAGGR